MDAVSAIFERESIREYRPDPIGLKDQRSLLHAGMSAPSAWNSRPWHFISISDRSMLDRIPEFHPYAGMLARSPYAILVCGNENANDPAQEFFAQNCAAAVENILIHAVELKLGAVWVGIYPNKERMNAFNKLFNIPQDITPFALISIGHPHGFNTKYKDRYDPSRVHTNQW